MMGIRDLWRAWRMKGGPFNADLTSAFWQSSRVRGISALGDLQRPFHDHSWTYAAIDATAEALSQLPMQVRVFRTLDPTEQGDPVDEDNPFQRVIMRPNPGMQEGELIYGISAHLDIYGESLLYFINRPDGSYDPRAGAPLSIWLVPRPKSWRPIVENDVIVGWQDGQKGIFAASQVLQIKQFDPDDMHRGLARLTPLATTLQTDYKAARFNLSWMDNGADPGGTITSPVPMTDEQRQAFQNMWEARHAGPLRKGRIAIMSNGMEYVPLKVSHQDMQFLDGRIYNRDETLAILGVPKIAVGLIDDINRNTAKETLKNWWNARLLPRLSKIKRCFERFMLEPAAGGEMLAIVFDTSNVEALQTDIIERIQQAEGLVKLGYPLNMVNERLNLGMPKVPGGDVPLAAGNLVPLEVLAAQEELPAPTPPPGAEEEAPEEEPEEEEAEEPEDEGEKDEEDEERSFGRRLPIAKLLRSAQGRKAYLGWLDKQLFHPAERAVLAGMRRYYRRSLQMSLEKFDRWAEINQLRSQKDLIPLNPNQIDEFLISVRALADAIRDESEPRFLAVARNALSVLEQEIGGFTVVQPDLNTPFVRDLVARRVASMIRLSASDRELIRKALLDKVAEGGFSDVQGIRAEIRKAHGGLSRVRALRIARTEAGILGNGVRFDAMRADGITQHEWVTAGDDVVRPEPDASPNSGNHRILDGAIVEIGGRFENGLRYPLDVGGPAKEVVNCRCRSAPVA